MKGKKYNIQNNLYIVIIFIVFQIQYNYALEIDKFLGVPDDKLELYKPKDGNFFQCLDGSKLIPYSALNDDYCDCPDGSDEPGTSACPDSTFYCKNKGHIPAVIPSSRVNDGVCDPECCDGSDENSGIIKCPNICEQVANEHNKEEIERKKILKEGLAKKAKYLEEASELVKKENSKKEKLEREINKLNSKIQRLEEIQLIAESVDKRVQNVKNEEVNKKIIENCPNVLRECNDGYNEIKSQSSKNLRKIDVYERGVDKIFSLIDDVQSILFDAVNKNKVNEAIESLKEIQGEIDDMKNEITNIDDEVEIIDENVEESSDDDDDDDDDVIKDNNKKNDHFPLDLSVDLDNIKRALELTSCEDSSKNIVFCIGSGFKSLFIGMKDNLCNDTRNLIGCKGWRRLKNPLNLNVNNIINKIKYLKKSSSSNSDEDENSSMDNELGINFKELKNNYLGVKSLLKNTRNDYDKKESELKKIKKNTDIDFGPNNVFRTLHNKCFDVESSGYIYSLCLFKDAKQKPKDGHSATSLGNWDKFESPTVMKFKNGEKCWNGPQRSATVILKCSDDNKLVSVSEPNKCEYEMIFYTPAVCMETNDNTTETKKDEL